MADGQPIVIAGGGIAGLAAAYRLQDAAQRPFIVCEKAPRVGGNSRTLRHGEFRFDLGGHRFYTKKAHVERLVRDLLGDDVLTVDRLSRILFNGRFVDYPLSAFNTLSALGPLGAIRAVFDYAAMKVGKLWSRDGDEETFEQWALNRFGEYLYRVYFKVYTEKTWGIPCTELSADFAEQRIKGLSFREAVKDALFKKGEDESLVRQFLYPRYGFGQLTDAMAGVVSEPNQVRTGWEVVQVGHDDERIRSVTLQGDDGSRQCRPCSELISSLPIGDLVERLEPRPPEKVLQAAERLCYRDMVILLLTLNVEQVSPDHWIYVPSRDIDFCRLHEPKNWSREMAPPEKTSLVIEYFCQEGDAVWNRDDALLAAEAVEDLERIGLVQPGWVDGHRAIRLRRAYPVYKLGYGEHLAVIGRYLDRFDNLYNVGRNASFLYTSSDHYIDMGLKAAENVLGHDHDLSAIGRERAYAEAWQKDEG
jgi:protoporphyrinogen oxidase